MTLLLFFISIVILQYFMTKHGVLATDYPFHYERLMELHQDMLTGQFPLIRQFYGAVQGSAVMVYYPWLTLIPMMLLTFVFHNYVTLLQVSAGLIVLGWLLSGFYASKSYFHSVHKAFYFSILYAGSMEAMIYEQCDIGTDLALIFVPLVFFGFIHLKEQNRWKMLTVGMTLLIYSHVVTSLIMIVFLLGLFLINIRSFSDKFKTVLLAGLITIGTTCLFWLPALWLTMQNSVTAPVNKYGFSHFGLWFFPALIIIVLPVVMTVAMIRHYSKFDKELLIIGVLCGLLMIKPIGNGVANVFTGLKTIQFSERFMPLLAIIGSYLSVKYVYMPSDKMLRKLFRVVLCFVVLLNPLIMSAKYGLSSKTGKLHKMYLSRQTFHKHMYKMPMSWAYDYTPENASKELHHLKYKDIKISAQGTHVNLKRQKSHVVTPVVLYKNVHYRLSVDGHRLTRTQIDQRMSRKYSLLVLRHLSKGPHMVRIMSVDV